MGLPPSRDSRTANSRLRSCSDRAIRYRYLARSLPGMARQSLSKASRAADTAASTSSGPASATSASFSSFDGLIVSKYRPDRASMNLPPMNNPYRSLIETISRDSGAGAYSQGEAFSGLRSPCRSISDTFSPWLVDSEVVGTLVGARPLLLDLHQHIVEECGSSDPEQIWGHPVGAQCLVRQDQVLDGLLGPANSTGHLDPDPSLGLVIEVAGRFHHAQCRGERRSRREFPRRSLDEVAAGGHGQDRRSPDLVVRADLGHALFEGGQAAGERSGHAGHLHPGPLQLPHRYGNELRVETHGCNRWDRRVRGVRTNGLGAHGHDLSRGVLPLQRGQVHRPDRQVQRPQLRLALDRTLAE